MEPEGRPTPIANFHSFTRLPKLTLLPFPPYRRAVKSIFEEYVSHFRYSRSYTLFRSFQLISLSISSQTARLPIPTSPSKHCFSHLLSYFLCNHSRKIPHSRRITQAAFSDSRANDCDHRMQSGSISRVRLGNCLGIPIRPSGSRKRARSPLLTR